MSVFKMANYIIIFSLYYVLSSVINLSLGQNRNLCDICDCLPNAAEPTNVNCNCRKNKILLLKEEDGDILLQTQYLNISSCNFLSFPPVGFPKSKKLKTVEIRQMKLFHLNSGIFPSLTSLLIEDVDELIIDGFQGQNSLANIEIRRSYLSEIAEDTFKAIKALSKLAFINVSIGVITTGSLSSSFSGTKPLLQFINCKVDEIQSESIAVQVYKLEIINTTINVIHPGGIRINATESVDISRCKFGANLAPGGVGLKAKSINIAENEFASLPSSFLLDMITNHDKKINFVNNIIHDIDLGGFLLNSKLDKLNFVKNKIVCDCSPRKTSLLKLKELFPGLLTNETYYDGIIDNNYCKNYGGIYLSNFKQQFLSGAVCNETDEALLKNVYSSEPTEKWLSLLQPTTTETMLNTNSSSKTLFSINLGFICGILSIYYFTSAIY